VIYPIKKRVTAFSTQYKGKLNSTSPDELLYAVKEMEDDKASSLLGNPLVQKDSTIWKNSGNIDLTS